jgi:Raf kinase inhibitor-like YbhB/YbcL family protein
VPAIFSAVPERTRVIVAACAMAIAFALSLSACGDDDDGGDLASDPLPPSADQIKLTSTAFKQNGTIPQLHTCDGVDLSPSLKWTGVPDGVRSFALLMEDPDAKGGGFVHWSLYDMSTELKELGEGSVPPKAKQGENSFGEEGYGGPCPPKGDGPHRYVFALYALRDKTGLDAGASPDEVQKKIGELAVVRGLLIGRYGR